MNFPKFVLDAIKKLEKAGFEAYIVGGCVRDLLMEKEPKDWDITTNARPEDILKILIDSKYENTFGTVLMPIKDKRGNAEQILEITTYRSEQNYSDRRHPDEIIFEDSLDKDLERRDFTINAMAMEVKGEKLKVKSEEIKTVDLFGGRKDLDKRIVRAVGEPEDRFKEDALRMMRAVRFSSCLNFKIEEKTARAIKKMAGGIKFVANERIKDELIKILESNRAYEGIILLQNLKLLQYIIPELERGVGVEQNKHHIYTVFKHSVLSLKYCPSLDWRVRLAALLHDIAKPQTKKLIKGDATFYNHDLVGAKIASKIMTRLRFANQDVEKVASLIKNHMFYYNVGEVKEGSVRRLIKKVGLENLKDLMDLRIADRLGSGVPKAKPYKLRHLEYMIEKVQNDPVSVKNLKINGDYLIKELGFKPGPKMGAILDALLAEVIEKPDLNNLKYLSKRSLELVEEDLDKIRNKAKEKIEEKKMEDDQELKKEFYVK